MAHFFIRLDIGIVKYERTFLFVKDVSKLKLNWLKYQYVFFFIWYFNLKIAIHVNNSLLDEKQSIQIYDGFDNF